MKIKLDSQRLSSLAARLEADEDAEKMADGEYVVDIYDFEPPLTMEIELEEDGFDVLACESLEFSEEMDGWYVSGRVEDPELIKRALFSAERGGVDE
ncbi:MAG: hypothetical protein Q4D04_06850 [Clostridia bacterium]|nr:hypothetical protein [Clostridia bacterium]